MTLPLATEAVRLRNVQHIIVPNINLKHQLGVELELEVVTPC